MSLICWNCRGLGQPRAVRALRGLVTITKPDLVFLPETKSLHKRMHRIQIKLGFEGCFTVDRRGISGGLCLLWRASADVTIRTYSQGHIDADIRLQDGQKWRFTGVYGSPYETQKADTWELLWRLSHMSDTSWLCAGDFNQVLYTHEKEGRRPPNHHHMRDFNLALTDCQLEDLGFNGFPYTRTDKREDGLVKERLDRAVATFSWRQLYPTWRVDHLGVSHSDHMPIYIQLAYDSATRKKWRPVQRFDPFWMRDEECWAIFTSQWKSPATMNDMMTFITDIRSILWRRSRDKYGSLAKSVEQAHRDLQEALDEGVSTDVELSNMQSCLGELEDMEEDYCYQQSRKD